MPRRKHAVKYRNVMDGRVVNRPAGRDEALERSVAWERIPARPKAQDERKDETDGGH